MKSKKTYVAARALERRIAAGDDGLDLQAAARDGAAEGQLGRTEHASEQRTVAAMPPRASVPRCMFGSFRVTWAAVRSGTAAGHRGRPTSPGR